MKKIHEKITVKNLQNQDIDFYVTIEEQKEHKKVSFKKTFYVLKSYTTEDIKGLIQEFMFDKRDFHSEPKDKKINNIF